MASPCPAAPELAQTASLWPGHKAVIAVHVFCEKENRVVTVAKQLPSPPTPAWRKRKRSTLPEPPGREDASTPPRSAQKKAAVPKATPPSLQHLHREQLSPTPSLFADKSEAPPLPTSPMHLDAPLYKVTPAKKISGSASRVHVSPTPSPQAQSPLTHADGALQMGSFLSDMDELRFSSPFKSFSQDHIRSLRSNSGIGLEDEDGMSLMSTNGTRVEDVEVSIDVSTMSQQAQHYTPSKAPVFVPVGRAPKHQVVLQPVSSQGVPNNFDAHADAEETACQGCPIC